MITSQGIKYLVPFIFYLSCGLAGMGQPTLDPDLKKPKKYENRILRAEKTGEKKFTAPRRFFQNTYTHYNYVFNAETKLRQVLESAKRQHIDQYSDLLSFYNYSLEATSAQKTELDSVIYKVNAGIFLHDLRSDWMDNLYLAMGQAYLLRNTLDSAYMTFQYMNYAFYPKDAEGYDRIIASNATENSNAMMVSTLENRNLLDRAFSRPPSRNDALLWLIRTHIERKEYSQARVLLQTLRNDPQFPDRLQSRLSEMQALLFYELKQYDSAAYHLGNALPAADTKQEAARWEFLMGQLYKRAGAPAQAREAFESAARHTLNPVMEVAAQMEIALLSDGSSGKDWQAVVATLEKMAKREKYAGYRDLIYYTIGELEATHEAYDPAMGHLHKSIRYAGQNPQQKSQSYYLLGELAFMQKQYAPARQYYDSVITSHLPDTLAGQLAQRRDVLSKIVAQMEIIERQDSLQALAAMPEAERMDILRKKLRQMRKQQAAAAAKDNKNTPMTGLINQNVQPVDMFTTGAAAGSNDFYFYNNSLKSRGYNEFRNKWGNRPNTDNWRRSSSQSGPPLVSKDQGRKPLASDEVEDDDPSMEILLAPIPLTPEALAISQDSVAQARYAIALTLQNQLEDYGGAITEYEWIRENYQGMEIPEADLLYNMAICYRMLGRDADLARVNTKLQQKFPASRQASIAQDPLAVREADSMLSNRATEEYDRIYNQFLAGDFEAALDAKRAADALYGTHHWTPQLLYIESIYYIKRWEDSSAIDVLQNLVKQFPEHALAEKAATMMDVLRRRREIEEYLTNLQVERVPEDSTRFQELPTVQPAAPIPAPREARAATQQPLVVTTQPKADSTRLTKEAPKLPEKNLFSRHAEQPHFVVIVLTNVDPVYVNETKNAFDRYHREKYYNQPMNITIVSLTDTVKLVAIRGMENEAAAMNYIERAKALAENDIIPWLKKDNYYFLPVAEDNMNLLL
ncbi:MAG TPA: tetratricopeptide repeat protein, partial [Flavihumibacter sp.]